jgi:hypothetical protein
MEKIGCKVKSGDIIVKYVGISAEKAIVEK